MWKLLVISTFLVATQAANIENFYGQWVPMLNYPESAKIASICLDATFEKSPQDSTCSCADGRSLTLVKITSMQAGYDTVRKSAPLRILAVDTAAEVEPAFTVNCGECGKVRGVFRSLGDNYFMFIQKAVGNVHYAEVMAKKVVSREKFISDLEAIEDLKGKKGNIWCTSETYPQKL